MKIKKSLAVVPLTALVALAPNVQGENLGGREPE
jgi:hemolysin activation/secretion protein